MTGWRALLRLAARDARRDRWRTVLVVVLIALPVAGLGAVIGIADTTQPTAAERVRDSHGDANLLVGFDAVEPAVIEAGLDAFVAELPAGSVVHPLRQAADTAVADGRARRVELSNAAPGEGSLTAARYRIVEGRAPATDREVLVPPRVAETFEVAVGDTLELQELGPVTVTGLVVRREQLWATEVLFAPDVTFPARTDPGLYSALLSVPDGRERQAQQAVSMFVFDDGTSGWAETRGDALQYRFSDNDRFAATVVGGLGAVEAALIAGAAFAVSVRRRQRELGLLAAVGGSERQVRRVVQLTGFVAGAVGALVGLVLAVAIVVFGEPLYGQTVGRELAGPRLDVAWLVGVGVLGALSAAVGAAWPARTVSRLPIVVALSGRRPVTAPSRRGLLAGLSIAGVGVLILGVVAFGVGLRVRPGPVPYLLGSVLVVLGVGALSPWALERLATIAPRLPVGPRLAVRDAARFRTRNGPIVTAAMAGLAAMVTVTMVFGSLDRAQQEEYRPSLAADQVLFWGESGDAVARSLVAEVGGDAVSWGQLNANVVTAQGEYLLSWPDVGGPEVAEVLGGPDAAAALADGKAVVFEPIPGDQLGFARPGIEFHEGTVLDAVAATVDVHHVEAADPSLLSGRLPTVLLSPDLAEDLVRRGIATIDPGQAPTDTEVVPTSHLAALDGPADAAAIAAADRLTSTTPGVSFYVEEGYRSEYRGLTLAATAAGSVLGLVLVAVALALASAEARADGRAMAAVGAGRRTRRSLAAGRALLLAGLAGVLAVPVGVIPAVALLTRLRPGALTLQLPWLALALAVVVVPLLAAAGAGLGASRAPKPAVRLAA